MRVWLPFDPAVLGVLPDGVEVDVYAVGDDLPDTVDEVELYVPDYVFDQDVLGVIPRLPNLRIVQTLTAGVEHVRPYLSDGLVLCNARGVHDTSTAELAVALVLASLRGIPEFVRAQATGEWRQQVYPALADRTVLVVGYGSIGAALERRLAPFECDVLRVARTGRDGVAGWESLPELLPRADVVVLLVPMTTQTTGMVDGSFLARMKDGALLVNMSRGAVVRTDSLLAECRAGRLRAALDVTDPEPLPPDHPLWQTPGVLISPHVGGASTAFWPRAHALVRDQLQRYAAGEPLANIVSGDY